jgi:hypothetical protein
MDLGWRNSFKDYETSADNAISKAISDRDTVSVMLMRYALLRDWRSRKRKRHRRIRTADSKEVT